MYLGYMGYKTANVPVVPGIEPPKALFKIDPAKIVGLTIDAGRLAEIRQARVAQTAANARSTRELVEIYEELEHAEKIHRRLGCPVLDITELSIEETATRVVKLVEQRRAEAPRARRRRGDEASDPAVAVGDLVGRCSASGCCSSTSCSRRSGSAWRARSWVAEFRARRRARRS